MVNICILGNVNRAWKTRTEKEVPQKLAEFLSVPMARLKTRLQSVSTAGKPEGVDWLISVDDLNFVVECRASSQASSVVMAVRSVKEFAGQLKKKNVVPLVVVPYMGEVGKKLCAEAGVSWLDLSGNAYLVGPGIRVEIEGKPNQFKRPGRPRSLFAPKSSRITRCLLVKPNQTFSQRELAKESKLDEGFTSRIVRQLEQDHLVSRDVNGAVKVADFGAMLEAWREVYDFSKHHIVRGHIAARSSDEIVRRLSDQLKRVRVEHAVTGLAGAWLLNQFAGFRLVIFYVDQIPSAEIQQAMSFREEQHGENVWLVVPNDDGVFYGTTEYKSVRCVHPVQVYLDLKDHPERSTEAAEQLRRKFLIKDNHV